MKLSFKTSPRPPFAVWGLALLMALPALEARIWTSSDGRTIEAEFVEGDDSSVTVRTGSREVRIPFEKLAEADIAFAKEMIAKGGEAELADLGEYAEFAKGDWGKGDIEDLKFQIWAPAKFKKDQKLPLVVFLHGVGERGEDNERQVNGLPRTFASPDNQAKRPCIVVAPQCPSEVFWSSSEITERVIALTEDLAENLPVDEDRIYISGFSMGGYGTWSAIGAEPKLFAAAIPIAGGGNPDLARDLRKLPIWNFHGDKDDKVSVEESRKMVEALEKSRANITYTEFEGAGHGIADRVLQDEKVQAWLFAQKKGG